LGGPQRLQKGHRLSVAEDIRLHGAENAVAARCRKLTAELREWLGKRPSGYRSSQYGRQTIPKSPSCGFTVAERARSQGTRATLILLFFVTSVPELATLIQRTAAWLDELRMLLPVPIDLDVMNDGYLRSEILDEIAAHGRLADRSKRR
jgi:hypothetical protein